jgi:hypothetical protein
MNKFKICYISGCFLFFIIFFLWWGCASPTPGGGGEVKAFAPTQETYSDFKLLYTGQIANYQGCTIYKTNDDAYRFIVCRSSSYDNVAVSQLR